MNNDFERKVRGAGVAGWWTILAIAAVLIIQWVVYLIIISFRPAWFLSILGSSISWEYVQHVWFLGIVLMKIFMLVLAIPILWLTLWARELRKM